MVKNKRRKKSSQGKYRTILFWFIASIMICFYLWGTVQIDFMLRQNDSLKQKKQILQNEIDDLHVQLNTLSSYQRIVTYAKKSGMVFLSVNHKKELPVDLKDVDTDLDAEEYGLRYAGFYLMDLGR